MDELLQKFIDSSLRLGKELLDKETLTENEKRFLNDLDLFANKFFQKV